MYYSHIELGEVLSYSDVSVVIPCFNESTTILKVINDLRKKLPKCRIVVVDNLSNDGTGEIARTYSDLLVVEQQKGKGYAFLKGVSVSKNRIIVLVDGDATYDLKNLKLMINSVRNGIDMSVGTRIPFNSQSFPYGHGLGNRFFSKLQKKSFNSKVEDAFSGLRVFSSDFLTSYVSKSRGFELETSLNFHAWLIGADVTNFDCKYYSRLIGSESKLSTFSDGIKITKSMLLLLLKWKPAIILGIFIFLNMLLATALMVIPVTEYFKTGKILHIPTLLVSLNLYVISSVLLIYTLIISRIINLQLEVLKRDYRYFKLQLR
jgi:glycosyltransferase involved in cell wall biosynthesis